MAEAVALIASIITTAALIKQSIRRVRTFLRASEEILALQEQVEDFAILVEDTKDHCADNSSHTIVTALNRAKSTLGQIDGIIKAKILRDHDERLADIQRTVSTTYRAVLSQSTAMRYLLQSCSSDARSHIIEQAYHPKPASPLELSRRFFPETYTIDDRFSRSCLIIIR
ncbi:MAG: hypothetical protein Q9213_004910 [Squamulea squamosa]